jgi:hypothetical protein
MSHLRREDPLDVSVKVTVIGEEAGIEAGSWGKEARSSSIETRASIRASTTINFDSFDDVAERRYACLPQAGASLP